MNWSNLYRKFNIWFPTTIIGGLGLMMLYFYFFPTIPNQDDLLLIRGTIFRTKIIDDDKYIYLYEFNNSFDEPYLSRKEFREMLIRNDSITFHIGKKDQKRLNKGSNIKLWSMKLNRTTYYTAKQEIKRQTFYKDYILPVFAIACLILAPIMFKYQVNRYKKKSTKNFS